MRRPVGGRGWRVLRYRTIAVSALLAGAVTAQATTRVVDPRIAAIDALCVAHVADTGRAGLSVGVVVDGELALAKGYGRRSLENDAPVTIDTVFPIGSVTKQFTCACVLLLAEDGKLTVDDPVAKYYPELTRADDITLRDLMNHTSGYPDYYPLDFVDRRMREPIEPDALLRRYAGGELDFEPGTEWSYSNTGFVLLGRIVEKVSGERFGAFLKRRILDPLGMEQTLFEPDPSDERLAHGYVAFALGPPEPNTPEARGWVGAAGAICSTPTDLARWDRALLAGKLLAPASFELMTRPRRLRDGRITSYGCGVGVTVRGGHQVLTHGGAVSGFVAWNAVAPSARVAVILLGNDETRFGPLGDRILDELLQKAPNLPAITGAPTVDTVRTVFAALQRGDVDRARLTADFDEYLNDERVAGAARRLARYGAPASAEQLSVGERGGMEVSRTRLTFASGALVVLMYRHADGSIAQFFVAKE